jgi:Kef-type K+ transport system membrane component KefB
MRRAVTLIVVVGFMALALHGFGGTTLFPEARSTMTFGFLLLTAYLLGDLLSRLNLPRITGYILAGILFGPHLLELIFQKTAWDLTLLELISKETVQDLKLLDNLALTFIALAAGGELRLKELRERRKAILLTVLFLTTVVFAGVAGFTLVARPLLPFLDGKPFLHLLAVAALLGTLAVARSPSSAIAIISETKARGPFTEMVLGVTVVMDVLVIMIFAVMVSLCQALVIPGTHFDFAFVMWVFLEIAVSITGGLVLGKIIALYIQRVRAELPVFILALAFMVAFLSKHFAKFMDQFYGLEFHLEPMLICMTAGFMVQNFSPAGKVFMEKIDRSSTPVYVLFFSLTGASLDVSVLSYTWKLALMVAGVRIVFIWIGAYLGARFSKDPKPFRRMSGLSFITQAGVSLGLAGIVMNRFPDWGEVLAATIVAIITVNQIIGPVTFKIALNTVGEADAARRAGNERNEES